MTLKSKVPEIRFEGFSGEWEERRMLDCSSKIGDGLHGTPIYTDNSGIYFINGNNLILGSICITNETKQVNKNDQSKDDKNLGLSTILMSINGTIGNLAWYKEEKVMLGKSVAYINLENCDNNYMYTYLQTSRVNNYFFNNLTGSTIKNLGLKTIRETEVLIPNKSDEQTKIGTYFQNLDSLITQHQQKHEKLLNIKKAMLEKMFPKDGADVPEIRFEGFDGEWVEKELENIADIIGGGTPSTNISEYWDGNIDWYSPTEIGNEVYANGSVKKITLLGLEKSSATILPSNKTILFTSRAGIGDMAILRKNGSTNQGFQSLILKDEYDTYFIYSAGYLIKEYALKYSSGSTFLEISGKQLGKMNIKIPLLKEQTKIGNFFKKLDDLISLQQTKLKKLKNIKKASLEKMFV